MREFNLENVSLEVMDARELEQVTGGLSASFGAGATVAAGLNVLNLVGVSVGVGASASGSVSALQGIL